MYNVMYNIHTEGVGPTGRKEVFHAIQEGKRHIIKKRYQRCANPNLENIIYDGNRVISHWCGGLSPPSVTSSLPPPPPPTRGEREGSNPPLCQGGLHPLPPSPSVQTVIW